MNRKEGGGRKKNDGMLARHNGGKGLEGTDRMFLIDPNIRVTHLLGVPSDGLSSLAVGCGPDHDPVEADPPCDHVGHSLTTP